MDIYQLQVFLAVYRQKSFSAASKELHLTQPAVSMHIKKLEDELQVRLFERIGRTIKPTAAGDLLLSKADEIVSGLANIKLSVRSQEPALRGILTIGATAIPGSYVLPTLAADFSKQNPEIFFQVAISDSESILDQIESGALIAGIVDMVGRGSKISSVHTFQDELVLIAAPGFLGTKELSPLKLFSIPLLMREDNSEARRSMEKQHLLHKISMKALNVKAILGSTDSLREAVKAGLGATILSRYVVKNDLEVGSVEEIRIKGVKMQRLLHVAIHAGRPLPDHYQRFILFLKEKIQPA